MTNTTTGFGVFENGRMINVFAAEVDAGTWGAENTLECEIVPVSADIVAAFQARKVKPVAVSVDPFAEFE